MERKRKFLLTFAIFLIWTTLLTGCIPVYTDLDISISHKETTAPTFGTDIGSECTDPAEPEGAEKPDETATWPTEQEDVKPPVEETEATEEMDAPEKMEKPDVSDVTEATSPAVPSKTTEAPSESITNAPTTEPTEKPAESPTEATTTPDKTEVVEPTTQETTEPTVPEITEPEATEPPEVEPSEPEITEPTETEPPAEPSTPTEPSETTEPTEPIKDLYLDDYNYPNFYGRLYIPSVGIDVALYYGNDQAATDRKDSASIFAYGTYDGEIIADHSNQDFSKLFGVSVGDTGYIRLSDGGTINIRCAEVFNGHNTGTELTDNDYKNVMGQYDYLMYTCRNGWRNILICQWTRC